MFYFLLYRIFRQIFSQPVYLSVRMVIVVQLIFQKLSGIFIYLRFKLFVWWRFKVIIEFGCCKLLSFGDELSFEVWKEAEFLLKCFQWGLNFVGRLKESFFVIVFDEGDDSVGFFDFLVDVFVFIGDDYLVNLSW